MWRRFCRLGKAERRGDNEAGTNAGEGKPPDGDLGPAIQVVSEIVTTQSNREDNLNTRGTAVAGAAGLIVTLAGGVAKTIFRELDDPWIDIAGGLFIFALTAVAAAILLVVLGVLKPRPVPTKPGEASRRELALALVYGHIDLSDARHVEESYLKLARAVVASWFRRNLEKQMYLRASYFCLAGGAVVFAITAVLIAMAPVERAENANDRVTGGEIGWIPLVVALAAVVVAAALAYPSVIARAQREMKDLEKQFKPLLADEGGERGTLPHAGAS